MKEWKAPEKEAQKMTRDGAVSVNLVTGETTYPDPREPEQDHSASGDTAGAAGKVVDRVELHREQIDGYCPVTGHLLRLLFGGFPFFQGASPPVP